MTASAVSTPRQMAIDQVLAEAVWAARRPPTLRLYHWPAAGLTIGRHQSLKHLATPAVRRQTGGRAVHHENELTFCIALPRDHPLIQPTIRETYLTLIAPFTAALSRLGLAITLPRHPPRLRPNDRFACFAAPGDGEAMVGSNKVIAMAQRQTRHGLVAQGSIPIVPPTSLCGADNSAVVGLSQYLPGITHAALQAAILRESADCFAVRFRSTPLTPLESRTATRLARTRYRPVPATAERTDKRPFITP